MARHASKHGATFAIAATTDGDDLIVGTRADETLDGGAGNDRIIGGYGSDILNGGDGDDVLWADQGQWGVGDILTGGAGSDVFYFDHPGESLHSWSGAVGPTQDTITDFESGVDKIHLGGYIPPDSTVTFNDHGGGTWDMLVNLPNDDSNEGVDYLTMQINGSGDVPTLTDIIFGGEFNDYLA